MSSAPQHTGSELHELALTKMIRILGEQRARRLMGEVLSSLGIVIEGANDLLRFATELAKRPGFEGAVGAMLSVQAIIQGATEVERPTIDDGARRR